MSCFEVGNSAIVYQTIYRLRFGIFYTFRFRLTLALRLFILSFNSFSAKITTWRLK